MALIEEAARASRILLDSPYVRVAARAEPDAACAVALLGHALRRENVDFHVSWLPRLDPGAAHALADEAPDTLLLVGLSGDASNEPLAGARRVALDRAPATLEADATLDPSRAAEAHADLSLAGLAQLVAVAIGKRNADLAPIATAGALCAQGHGGRLRGLDAEMLAQAIDDGVVSREPALALHGATLHHALTQLDAPYVGGFTGRARNVKKLIQELDLAGDAPPHSLGPADAEKLGSYLALRLLEADAPDAAVEALFRPALRALKGPHTGMDARDVAWRAEAACAIGRPGLAFAAAWPEPGAVPEVAEAAAAFRDECVAALLRGERERVVEGPLLVIESPRATACAPLSDRAAASFARPAQVAVARHAEGPHVALALRAYAHPSHVGRALRHAVTVAGGAATGTRTEGRAVVDATEESRFRKALGEALA